MKLPSPSILLRAFLQVWQRFPATMLCAVVATSSFITAIEYDREPESENWVKLGIMSLFGLALCTGLTAFAESKAWSGMRNWALQALGLALAGLYYFLFDIHAITMEEVGIPRFMALWAVAHLLVAVAPYLNRLAVADFWEYNKQLFANFIIGGVYTFILYAGLALALLAVNELFNLDINGKMYAYLFAVLAGIFQTTFFLYHFPKNFGFDDREKAYNVVFKNLCQYILIPIVGLYFLILYAYSIKILVTWNLPQGWVSSLVLGFSVAGIFTYLINYLLPDFSDNKLVHAYRRWFWWVLLPMVGLLFVAIGRRISDYGITEQRYYVAHAGVWLLVMCLYFLRSKLDNIKFIPISLGLFVLVAVLGPFSAFNVAERNQTAILKNLLEKNNRFDGDKLKPGGDKLTGEDADRIMSCLRFLGKRDAMDRIESWLPVPIQTIEPDTSKYAARSQADAIATWLNVEPEGQSYRQQRMVSVYPMQQQSQSGNIAGFRQFYQIELYDGTPARKRKRSSVTFSDDQHSLLLYGPTGKIAVDSFDLRPAMEYWKKMAGSNEYYALPDSATILELKSARSTGRLHLREARFDTRTPDLKMESLNGLLFVK
ncbi:MAG: DUF4153 domain-containing protein [Lewinellaceae bacterium]|nr:DUF4153 domain-containing protein [Saprospiraceae bacterium]MCB9316989.1 DUF4153 domain-containing protein [Lewinellaceae bacterium]MCB9330195.1 DUF4153 domain-containing protein [Lewinellaceae bacterium]